MALISAPGLRTAPCSLPEGSTAGETTKPTASLGNGTTTADSDVPTAVVGLGGVGTLTGVTSLVDKEYGFCALLGTGGVDCWGYDEYGELGNGTTNSSDVPTAVLGLGGVGTLSGVQSLTAASYGNEVCALLTDSDVACWGLNDFGEVGYAFQ